MRHGQVEFFETFGFLQMKGLLSVEDMKMLSAAFDAAMEVARKGGPAPASGEKRQQVVPFFDYDPVAFYPLLDDSRILDVFEALMEDDFIFTLSEGILHTGGTKWHHDALAPDGFFSMRAAIYLDALGPDEGCLSVVPGSHTPEFGKSVKAFLKGDNILPTSLPGRHPLVNEPGDVIFMNHKIFHSALGERWGRRAIHINCVRNASAEENRDHFDWLMKFLAGETRGWGRFYSDRLIRTAGSRRKRMMQRAIELGFGNTGPVTQRQGLT